jgi:hypothetical protein
MGKNHPAIGIGCTHKQNIIFVFRGDWVFANDNVGMGFQFWEVYFFDFSLF